jgi:hypothetical protein
MNTIDFVAAYETLARHVATHYGNDMLDENRQSANLMRVLMTTYPEVFDSIEAQPQDWIARVNDYLRGIK